MDTTKPESSEPVAGPVERPVMPTVRHCPFCGSNKLKFYGGVPRCLACRSVFHVQFSRYTRRPRNLPLSVIDKLADVARQHGMKGIEA